MGIVVKPARTPGAGCTSGREGVTCHLGGTAATISAIALATGGIGAGKLIESDK